MRSNSLTSTQLLISEDWRASVDPNFKGCTNTWVLFSRYYVPNAVIGTNHFNWLTNFLLYPWSLVVGHWYCFSIGGTVFFFHWCGLSENHWYWYWFFTGTVNELYFITGYWVSPYWYCCWILSSLVHCLTDTVFAFIVFSVNFVKHVLHSVFLILCFFLGYVYWFYVCMMAIAVK